ncbi:MAG TPA: CDP-alcohol phosphatidyltransferase family protein [Phycisphaerales bacterium]|nr:CDP-alcohol phosphatidyltransferase family protein [Phycisphaerales bacterium]
MPSLKPEKAGGGVVAGPWERAAPNLLTAARVVLAIAFFAVLAPWKYHKSVLVTPGAGPDLWLLLAAAIFGVAAITDVLDGYLARKWNAITTFGRIMDPFADKFLVIGAFVFLASPGFTYFGEAIVHLPGRPLPPVGSVTGVQAWMVALILARELLVTSIRAEVEGRGGSFAAAWSGKLKMILQSVCVPTVLVLMNFRGDEGHAPGTAASNAILVVVWATILVTAWSAVPYITRAVRVLGPRGDVKGGA